MRVFPATEVSDPVSMETKVRLWEKGLRDIFFLNYFKILPYFHLSAVHFSQKRKFVQFLSIIYVAPPVGVHRHTCHGLHVI